MSLPERWTALREHQIQLAYWRSQRRFNIVPAGRRSGKTELAKRKLVKRTIAARAAWVPRFFAGAPTRDQAKRIFWADLKALMPRELVVQTSESDLMLKLVHGPELWVVGMDKPERIEGQPWDGGVLDEFANMKAQAWQENVRPALSDRQGWCDLIGVPEGRNHYYDLWKYATGGSDDEWAGFTWYSADILPPKEIESARRTLDPLTFEQEYEGSFINFEGRCYYPFLDRDHAVHPLAYNADAPLIVCFDFNVAPGVAAMLQEQVLPGQYERDDNGVQLLDKPVTGTGIISEVHIPRNSNTPAVCRKVIELFPDHRGSVLAYGDATGGLGGSAKVQGSDWDLIRAEMHKHYGDRFQVMVRASNPSERARVNAVNSRLKSSNGTIRLMVDPAKAPNTVKDFEGVRLLEGGSGEIDKKLDLRLTHLTDAIGYYVHEEFPVVSRAVHHQGLYTTTRQ